MKKYKIIEKGDTCCWNWKILTLDDGRNVVVPHSLAQAVKIGDEIYEFLKPDNEPLAYYANKCMYIKVRNNCDDTYGAQRWCDRYLPNAKERIVFNIMFMRAMMGMGMMPRLSLEKNLLLWRNQQLKSIILGEKISHRKSILI